MVKSTDNSLNSQPKYFWKYEFTFRNHRSGPIQLEVDGAHLIQPGAIADVSAKNFRSVYNNNCPMDSPILS
jgi:hypothetical protein